LKSGYPEYGRLRKVLMHAPGKEIDLIDPRTYKRWLFEDAIDPEEFQKQHEGFVNTLRSEGVDVLLLSDILGKEANSLKLIEGQPNLVFTRDLVTITSAGYILMRMKSPVRRRETEIVEKAVHRLGITTLMKAQPPATIEGGDLIFADEETLLLGVGRRTNSHGLQQINRAATKSGLHRIVAMQMPPWTIHLDGTMMIIDRDLAIIHAKSARKSAAIYENGKLTERVQILEFLRRRKMKLIEVTDYERRRRATNLIAISPRKIVGYAGNARVTRELLKSGVDFIGVEGSELIRGAGGPRCMTAPLLRD